MTVLQYGLCWNFSVSFYNSIFFKELVEDKNDENFLPSPLIVDLIPFLSASSLLLILCLSLCFLASSISMLSLSDLLLTKSCLKRNQALPVPHPIVLLTCIIYYFLYAMTTVLSLTVVGRLY